MKVISKRFEKYGLTVHPEKTKLIDFRAPHQWQRQRENRLRGEGEKESEPETFDLLGFTHFWCKTKRGGWAVQRKTMKSRLAGAVERIDQWCCKNRHKPIREQWTKLCQKVRGHYVYYAITGNNRSLANFLRLVNKAWKRWLNRRNEKRPMNWEKFNRLLQRYPLPPPKIIHGKHRMFNT